VRSPTRSSRIGGPSQIWCSDRNTEGRKKGSPCRGKTPAASFFLTCVVMYESAELLEHRRVSLIVAALPVPTCCCGGAIFGHAAGRLPNRLMLSCKPPFTAFS
jgi:hypothetical protein